LPTLDEVKDEIYNTRQNQRQKDMLDKINASFGVEQNERYFGLGEADAADD
jgi:hypothetical protein